MKEVDIIYDKGCFTAALHDYPCGALSDALCKLSEHGSAKTFPTGTNPKLPWIWEFKSEFQPAIDKLFIKHGYVINNTHEQT